MSKADLLGPTTDQSLLLFFLLLKFTLSEVYLGIYNPVKASLCRWGIVW